MNKETVVEQIIQHHKNLGFDVDGKGYLKSSEDNLIELFPNWDKIKNELNNGTGGELKSDENDRVKFCAVHSSSALCVNSFALFKRHSHKSNYHLNTKILTWPYLKQNWTQIFQNQTLIFIWKTMIQ